MNAQSVKRMAEISSRNRAPTARHVRVSHPSRAARLGTPPRANGPGNEPRNKYQALKVRDKRRFQKVTAPVYFAPSGLRSFLFTVSRGVAPGYYISRLQRDEMSSPHRRTTAPLAPRSFFSKPGAHSKRMTIRMAQMKLAHVPGFIRRRHRHCQSILQREFVRSIDCGR